MKARKMWHDIRRKLIKKKKKKKKKEKKEKKKKKEKKTKKQKKECRISWNNCMKYNAAYRLDVFEQAAP